MNFIAKLIIKPTIHEATYIDLKHIIKSLPLNETDQVFTVTKLIAIVTSHQY